MRNYHYIISGLPDIALDFENTGFDLESLFAHISDMSTPEDIRCIEWLFFGLKEENLNNHFYRAARKMSNKFIREYFTTDLEIRNIQAAYLARKSSQDPSDFVIGSGEFTDALKNSKAADMGITHLSELSAPVLKILENENILEREQLLDLLRWERANEICTFSYFDINVILSFLLKASIVKRWAKLDRKRGAVIFKKFVDEVKGSFNMDNKN